MQRIRRAFLRVVAGLLMAAGALAVLQASQNTLQMPTSGIVTGLQFSNLVTNALDSLVTCNSGTSAPTNAAGGAPKLGQCWMDTTTSTLPVKKRYTGSAWVIEGVLDVTNGQWHAPIGGGVTTLASASTTNLWSVNQAHVSVTGTTTITSLASGATPGSVKVVRFTDALTLTHNGTSLILPTNAANIATAAGDSMVVLALTATNVAVVHYQRASGQPTIGLSTSLDAAFGSTRGSLLRRGAAGWELIAPGTSGHVLTSNGAGADPTYQAAASSGAAQVISSQVASASSTIEFTGLDDTYDHYEVRLANVRFSTNSVSLRVEVGTGGGPTWQTSGYNYSVATFNSQDATDLVGANGQAALLVTTAVCGNTSGDNLSGLVQFDDPDEAGLHQIRFVGSCARDVASVKTFTRFTSGGHWATSQAITGIRFSPSAGNFASGRFTLLGYKHAP